ncbi:MAG: cystathionine gamma-synthase [Gaiellales bacterium]|jgi:cystathionine gamma-synthase|nr:cystathionine gamma-synthase [Gaiellales bacterium]
MDPESALQAASRQPGAGLAPSLERSVTFHNMPLAERSSPYGRSTVPVASQAERILGEIEDSTAILFSSGMTAWTMLCLTALAPGRALAIADGGYYGVETLAGELLEPWGVKVRRYPARDMNALAKAADGAALVLIETPMNPTLDVIDIALAAEAVHAGGALLVCDNTVASPLQQRPLDLGADVCLQSGTKYLSGHSDTLAGVLSLRDPALADRLIHLRTETGTVLAPDPAWLLLRGLRTLAVRVARQSASALLLAGKLGGHARVAAVHYPGLPGDRGHELAKRQMRGGFGGMLSFQVADAEAAEAVERALHLIHPATSLGSVESLIERRGRIEQEGRVPEGLLRLSVGLEHPDDLWVDLEQALDTI